mgnify:CR=1 FL=1
MRSQNLWDLEEFWLLNTHCIGCPNGLAEKDNRVYIFTQHLYKKICLRFMISSTKVDFTNYMFVNSYLLFIYFFVYFKVFCAELQVFLREHRNGMYRTDIYFLCKTIAECPIFITMPLILTAICYFLIGLNPNGPRFFIACGILVLVANVATSFGNISSKLYQSITTRV